MERSQRGRHAVRRPLHRARAVPLRSSERQADRNHLPRIGQSKAYVGGGNVTGGMKVFAQDRAVVSIGAELASTNGLERGVGAIEQRHAVNAGVAEAKIMLIGEAFAAHGRNTWISTF